MRVLAIRGRNLASLEGAFEVDFEAEPLASAGIFAITGPTGAGKSTLLDAMCLALFNSLPRLASAGSGHIGIEDGQSISAGDPRAALRHRCGEGHAEIDFVGRDGARYRARWSARRARGRGDGALQAASIQLTRLDTGERIGGHNTETLQEIRDRVGLNEQQFARAVLLAQGEFDAFVRANPNDRAQLLEKLTGTEIYARLGVAARRKAEALRAGLAAIEQRIVDFRGLHDAARTEAEGRLESARQAVADIETRLAALAEQRLWHETSGRLRSQVALAETASDQARAAHEAAAPRRAKLERRAAAAALVGDWRMAAEARMRVSEGDASVKRLEREIGEAATEAEGHDAAAADAQSRLSCAETELEGLRPELQLAGALDGEIEEARSVLEPLRETVTRSGADLDAADARVNAAEAARRDAQTRSGSLSDWLSANAERRTLADRELALAADLAEHVELTAKRATSLCERDDAEASLAQLAHSMRGAEEALALAASGHEGALDRVQRAVALAPSAEALDAAFRARKAIAAVEPRIEALQGCERVLTEAVATVGRVRSQISELGGEVTASRARLAELSTTLSTLRVRRDEARRSSDLSSAAASEVALRLREALSPGEPCPVCGSHEHQLGSVEALVRDRADQDILRVGEVERELLEAERAAAVDGERARTGEAMLTTLADRLASVEEALSRALATRDRAQADLAEAAASAGVPATADLAAMRADVTVRLAGADEAHVRLEEARRALEAARSDAEEHRQARGVAERARQRAEADDRAARETRDRAAGRLALQDEAIARLEIALDGALGAHVRWREERQPALALGRLVSEWRERDAEQARLAADLPGLSEALHSAELARSIALTARRQAEEALSSAEERLSSLLRRRAALLGGRGTAEVTNSLHAAVTVARDTHEAARARQDASRNGLAALDARLASARETLAEGMIRAERLEARLATGLERAGLVPEEVSAEADALEGDLEQERGALRDIEIAFERASAQLLARRRDLTMHEATPVPELGEAEMAEALASTDASANAARAEEAEAALVIRQDDQARAATATLRSQLAAESEAARVWLGLEDLIGDATGSRFRRFAQGLTLDRLLAHANARLFELKPRYELQRGFGGEMLIQVVDHDLAGEVRGLHNLSGGERFLVSLALALGLSEMSTAEGLRIESLFIDEGFGALDSDSLGAAIAMLEQLHATGRRVGVISHIEEVKERIPVKVVVSPISRGRSAVEVIAD